MSEIKTETIYQPQPGQPYVGEDGIYMPYEMHYHRMMISKELFVAAYNKWIKGEENEQSN